MLNGTALDESLADLMLESSPTKNKNFSDSIDIEFMNGGFPGTNFNNQKIEYEELSLDTKLLD